MLQIAKNIYDYRELMATLAWKNIALRYKQAYLGILWAVIKPIMLMLIFTLVRSFSTSVWEYGRTMPVHRSSSPRSSSRFPINSLIPVLSTPVIAQSALSFSALSFSACSRDLRTT